MAAAARPPLTRAFTTKKLHSSRLPRTKCDRLRHRPRKFSLIPGSRRSQTRQWGGGKSLTLGSWSGHHLLAASRPRSLAADMEVVAGGDHRQQGKSRIERTGTAARGRTGIAAGAETTEGGAEDEDEVGNN
jgi:hypothetical protein